MEQLDFHLRPHVGALWAQMRRNMLVQYVAPFSTVRLSSMAAAFGAEPEALEAELARLIGEERAIAARIDGRAGVLHARHAVREGGGGPEGMSGLNRAPVDVG